MTELDPVADWTAYLRAVEELTSAGEARQEDLAKLLASGMKRLQAARGTFVEGRPVTLLVSDLQERLLPLYDKVWLPFDDDTPAAIGRLKSEEKWTELAALVRKLLVLSPFAGGEEDLVLDQTRSLWKMLWAISSARLDDEKEAARAIGEMDKLDAQLTAMFDRKVEPQRRSERAEDAADLAKALVKECANLRMRGRNVPRLTAMLNELGALYRDRLGDRALSFLAFSCARHQSPEDEVAERALDELRATAQPAGIDPILGYGAYRAQLDLFFDLERLEESEKQLPRLDRTVRDAIEHIIARDGSRDLFEKLFSELAFAFGRQGNADGVIGKLFELRR